MPRKHPVHRTIAAAALLGAAALAAVPAAAQPAKASIKAEPAEPAGDAKLPEVLPDKPLEVGDKAPKLKLRNDKGEWVDLVSVLERGPVVLTFYRGEWCPYCDRELKGIQDEVVPAAEKLGATVLALSPEAQEHAIDLKEKRSLSFDLLHDEQNKVAKRFGIAFTLDADTVKKYKGYKIDVAAHNQTGKHELPIPATYVIDAEGVIRYAYVNEDYRERAKPKDVIEALEKVVNADD